MKSIAYAIALALAVTSVASAISVVPTRDLVAELRAIAAEGSRIDISEMEERIFTIDNVLPVTERANTPNCLNDRPHTKAYANDATATNVASQAQCGEQLHSGPLSGISIVVAGNGGSADAWNYGSFGYHYLACVPSGVSTAGVKEAMCAEFSYHRGIPLSQFTLWDGLVETLHGTTFAYYG